LVKLIDEGGMLVVGLRSKDQTIDLLHKTLLPSQLILLAYFGD